MNMGFSVYVGPFLACKRKSDVKIDACEITTGKLIDLRGDLSNNDVEMSYIGPGVNIPLIQRQLIFDPNNNMPLIDDISKTGERAAFIDHFFIEIADLRKHYESITVEWGVVPGAH
jgi:hypothetical protein